MAELDTMKQLKPHPHVIKLLGCVTESGELIHATVCYIRKWKLEITGKQRSGGCTGEFMMLLNALLLNVIDLN